MGEAMFRSANICFLTIALGSLGAGPSMAGPVDVVRTRADGYHAMGAAFKAANDALRGDPMAIATIRRSAVVIRKVSRAQYRWFPAGSGPRPGVKTAARPEIWTNAAAFRGAQDAFARQADAFFHAAAGNDATAIRSAARKLGATCKGCHDSFRESDD